MVWCKIANDTDFVYGELCDHLKKNLKNKGGGGT